MYGRFLIALGLALGGLAVLAFLAPGAEAATMTFDDASIREGQAVQITVTPSGGTNPPETFMSGDRLQVTDPANCRYAATVSAPSSAAWTVTYPTGFSADAGNAASCPASPHTALAGTSSTSSYRVQFVPGELQSQDPFIAPFQSAFRVLITDREAYNRTAPIDIQAVGFGANQRVNVQIDAPSLPAFASTAVTADGAGRIQSSFRLPRGMDGSVDLGQWSVRLVPTTPGPKAEDRQTFLVTATDVLVEWDPDTVPDAIARANPVAFVAAIYYDAPGSDNPLPLRSADVTGSLVDVVLERNGQSVQTASASYDAASGLWRASFQMEKNAPTGTGYTLSTASNLKDRFGNPIARVATPSFAITNVTAIPTFEVVRATVERGSLDQGLSVNVRLAYPSGAPVTLDDLRSTANPDGVLQAALYRGTTRVPGSLLLGVNVGPGLWEFKDQVLPKDTPLGQLTMRLLPGVVNPNAVPPNGLDTGRASDPITIVANHPRLSVSVLKDNVPVTGVLRNQEILLRMRALYPNGAAVTHDDTAQGGRSVLRMVYGDGTTCPTGLTCAVSLDLQYDPATSLWETRYTPPANAPVGSWSFTTLVTDNWGNDNASARSVRIGLQVTTQLSATSLARSGELTVTSAMSMPGSTDPLTGSMNVTLLDPTGKALSAPIALSPITGGKFQAKVQFPVNATLGAYKVVVRGASASDAGQDVQTINLGSASMLVQLNVTAASQQRLGPVGVTYKLQYPNGAVPAPGILTTTLVFDPSKAGAANATVPATYDAATKTWSGNFTPGLAFPLGAGHFVLTVKDNVGNSLTGFHSAPVRIDPAEVKVTSLSTLRTQYLRGETVTVRALLAYSDGTTPANLTVPAALFAGPDKVATLSLAWTGTAWEGTHALALDAPLGTAAKPWRVVVAKESVKDLNGNVGPAVQDQASSFNVQPAVLGVTILEQAQDGTSPDSVRVRFAVTAPDGTRVSLPASGLRALLVRNGQVSNDTLDIAPDGDAYVVTVPKTSRLAQGLYAIRLEGSDATGNAVTALDTQSFTVQAQEGKDAPAPGAFAALAAVGAAALLATRRQRRL